MPSARCMLVLGAIILAGLGPPACKATSPTSPTSPTAPSASTLPVSQSSITSIVNNFAKGASNAANTSTSFNAPGFSSILPRELTSVLVNESFSQRTMCTGGGYHETLGRITGTIDPDRISRLTMNSTTAINDYRCLAGGWTVSGDPYISNTGEIRITGNRVSFDFRQSLGWKALNMTTGATFSCQHSVSVIWDDFTGGRIQGHVTCGPPMTTILITGSF